MPMTDSEFRDQTNDALRAVGRYVVEFSRLVSSMRQLIADRLTRGHYPRVVGELTLGDATASQIADVFFGMCRTLSEPDDAEAKIASVLRKSVRGAIEKRNDVAHGDWTVGLVSQDDERVEPAELLRFRPVRSEGVEKREALSVQELDALSDSLIVLGVLVQEFGMLTLGLWAESFGPRLEKRDPSVVASQVRVRDVLEWDGQQITRTGPMADKVVQLVYLGGFLDLS